MRNRSAYFWVIAIVITLGSATYQRLTGPTYPMRGSGVVHGEEIRYRLVRSWETNSDARVKIDVPDTAFSGYLRYKRLNVEEDWTAIPMKRSEGELTGRLPAQPPAGKLIYYVDIAYNGKTVVLNREPVVIRFKGEVPAIILIPHILLMFIAMLFSNRTGIEALANGKKLVSYSLVTVIALFLGGMILGPTVQKFAFGEFWTGWPVGNDLTDNKTLIAFIAWIVALLFALSKRRSARWWVLAASIALLLVYLIPHSLWGSELDYSTGTIETGKGQ